MATVSTSLPVLAVLTTRDDGGDLLVPAHLPELEGRVDVRLTEADGLAEALDGARALLLWDFFSGALREAWGSAGSLAWVHVAAAGVDRLVFPELARSEVQVTNARGVFDRPIAEFVLAALLAHVKDHERSAALQRAGEWGHRETLSLTGRRVLIVGTGAIGRETARLLRAVGMEVRGAGRTAREDPDFGQVVASGELAAHVGWADDVVCAAPLTAQTRDLFDTSVFDALRPGAHFVNIGRGASVDEDALLVALRAGRLARASLDVVRTEPLPADSPLWREPGVVLSPHMSGDVVGWRETLSRQFVDLADRWLRDEPFPHVVDLQAGFAVSGRQARA